MSGLEFDYFGRLEFHWSRGWHFTMTPARRHMLPLDWNGPSAADGEWTARLSHAREPWDGYVVPLYDESPEHRERREWVERRAARGLRRRRDPRWV